MQDKKMNKVNYKCFLSSILGTQNVTQGIYILKNKINNVDKKIKNGTTLDDEDLNTISDFRSFFSPIIKEMAVILEKLKIDKKQNITPHLVSRRLKRTPSILNKLERFPKMKLIRMQDVGGVRVVYEDLLHVVKASRFLKDFFHERNKQDFIFKREKNYIFRECKEDGYRSIHHIYIYNGKIEALRGFEIELQIRTTLQHLWATSVETFDLRNKTSIKMGQGQYIHSRFFYLASECIKVEENSSYQGHKKLSYNENRIRVEHLKEMIEIDQRHNILTVMRSIAEVSHSIENQDNIYGCLLILDLTKNTLSTAAFKKEDEKKYNLLYLQIEKENTEKKLNRDVVLVYVDDIKQLSEAFPNYYLDSRAFVSYFDLLFAYIKTRKIGNYSILL